MEALIDRVFTVAEQQYTNMDTRLTEKTLPRKDSCKLLPFCRHFCRESLKIFSHAENIIDLLRYS